MKVWKDDSMVEVDVKIQAGDLYDYMLAHTYNSPSGIMGSCFGAVLVVMAVMQGDWKMGIIGLIVLLYLPWTLFIKSRRQALNPVFQKPLHYKLDEDGITVSQDREEQHQEWGNMVKAMSTSRSIIVYTSDVNATIFPKRDLGEQKAAVIEMISTHMPPSKVKIKE